jgi:hypothetical protein
MSDRDALAGLIGDWIISAGETADEILAAGWRPPAQVIETVEQAEALPVGSIILERNSESDQPIAWLRTEIEGSGPRWEEFSGVSDWPTTDITFPAVVLYMPTENGDSE